MRLSLMLGIALTLFTGCRDNTDADEDGFANTIDCNDDDASINPDAVELCDGVDNNCDGVADGDATDSVTYYADADADGFGNTLVATQACAAPAGYVEQADDCDDTNDAVYPSAPEDDCTDPVDYNCDGSVGYADADADGFPACEDCDDGTSSINPQAIEVCDGIDNNCDAETDEDGALGATVWFADSDADTFGDSAATTTACDQPDGYVANDTDCNDASASTNPAAAEVCDEADNNCNNIVDEDATDAPTWYADSDADGFGGTSFTQKACAQPDGYVATNTDCNDLNPETFPDAAEQCDGRDNDCDGALPDDEADADADGFSSCEGDCDDTSSDRSPDAAELCSTPDDDDCDGEVNEASASDAPEWFADLDGDSYGNPGLTQRGCSAPSGFIADNTDCSDLNANVYPGAAEYCDNLDSDCDGETKDDDSVDAPEWYRDLDGDGHGGDQFLVACDQPSNTFASITDCDDTEATIYPGATEECDAIDNDCDGALDNGLAVTLWYEDLDDDGVGDPETGVEACINPGDFVEISGDCDDGNADVSPLLDEVCDDSIDNNCDFDADCDDLDECRQLDECMECGDGYTDLNEECDDGNNDNDDACANDCTMNIDLSGVYDTYSSEGRDVHVFKSDSNADLTSYETFCEDRGLAWFVPKSQPDAQTLIDTAYNYDTYHTWIITKNNTTGNTFGGYSVSTNGGGSNTSSTGFSAIRKWASSYCDPETYNKTRCWDSGHQYDWLVCETP